MVQITLENYQVESLDSKQQDEVNGGFGLITGPLVCYATGLIIGFVAEKLK